MKRTVILVIIVIGLGLNFGSIEPSSSELTSINQVDFSSTGYSLTETRQGVYEFSATVQHNGSDPATTGLVPIPWERVSYELALSNGVGLLNESIVDLDLNGDTDKVDSFNVTWFHNATRQWDATINDGSKEIHAYAITESPPTGSAKFPMIRNYSINGKSKLFSLDSEIHFLYRADNDWATFGLGETFIFDHPCPNFELILFSSKVTAIDFQINNKPVDVNFSTTVVQNLPYHNLVNNPTDAPIYVVPTETFDISPGELVNFSCTLVAHEATTFEVCLAVNWSPDGVTRYAWVSVWDIITLKATTSTTTTTGINDTTTTTTGINDTTTTTTGINNTTTTTTGINDTTTTTTTTHGGTYGYSVLTVLLVLLFVLLQQKRR
ncbi:MAG: hypothetical protein ACFFBQ_21500 [Promethearchaeota archaeon]